MNPYQSAIDACNDCATACERCAGGCLDDADVVTLIRCIRLDLDCAAVCRLTAQVFARNAGGTTAFATAVAALCAEACAACAAECQQHAMEHCERCAVACLRCADECRRLGA